MIPGGNYGQFLALGGGLRPFFAHLGTHVDPSGVILASLFGIHLGDFVNLHVFRGSCAELVCFLIAKSHF